MVEQKTQELQQRLDNEEIQVIHKENKVKDMARIRSYAAPDQFPSNKLKPGQVFVDEAHDTVLIPVKPNAFAPFHISTIKSA